MISATTAGWILIAALFAAVAWTAWRLVHPLPGTTSPSPHGPVRKRHGRPLTTPERTEWESLVARAEPDEWDRVWAVITEGGPVASR